MRHKLRQCKVCGKSFVEKAAVSEICFDCHSTAARHVPGPSQAPSPASNPIILATANPVVLGTAAAQLAASETVPQPEKQVTSDPLKLWQHDAKEAVSPARTRWASPPFKVGIEDYGESDSFYDPAPPSPSRQLRLRNKLLLSAALILFFFVWPVAPLHTPEHQIALNEPPPATSAAAQQPDAAQGEEQPPTGDQER